MEQIINYGGIIGIAILVGLIVVLIMMVVAILNIPRIARYEKAQLRVAIMKAKKHGANAGELEDIVMEAENGGEHERQKIISDYGIKS